MRASVTCLAAAAASLAVLCGQTVPELKTKLGDPAPEFTLTDAGAKRCALIHSRDRRAVALFLAAGPAAPQAPPDVSARLTALDATLLVVSDASIAARYVASEGLPAAFFLDASGVVRWMAAKTSLEELVRNVEQWHRGKDEFQNACARCHEDESYPRLKNLHGIGSRLTKQQILERMFPVEFNPDQIAVRSHVFNRRGLEALLVYVMGL